MADEVSEDLVRSLPISIGRLTMTDVDSAIHQLDQRIDEVKSQVFKTIQSHYQEFINTFQYSIDLSDEVNSLSKDLEDIRQRFESQHIGLEEELLESSEAFSQLKQQYVEYSRLLSVLKYLASIHGHFQSFDIHLEMGDFISVGEIIRKIDALLDILPKSTVDMAVFRILDDEYVRRRSLFDHRLETAFRKLLSLVQDDHFVEWTMTPRLNLNSSSSGAISTTVAVSTPVTIENLILSYEAMDIISLNRVLSSFSNDLLSLLSSILHYPQGQLTPTNKISSFKLSFSWTDDDHSPTSTLPVLLTIPAVCGNIFLFFEFLHDHLFSYLAKQFIQMDKEVSEDSQQKNKERYSKIVHQLLLDTLLPAFSSQFHETFLVPSIPHDRSSLDHYESHFGQHVRLLESKLHKLFHNIKQGSFSLYSTERQKSAENINEDKDNTDDALSQDGTHPVSDEAFEKVFHFTDFLDNIDAHFAERKRKEILSKARSVLLEDNPNLIFLEQQTLDQHLTTLSETATNHILTVTTLSGQTVQIDRRQLASMMDKKMSMLAKSESALEGFYHGQFLAFPSCTIRDKTKRFVDILLQLVSEAKQMGPPLSGHYFFLLRDLLDLYRALMSPSTESLSEYRLDHPEFENHVKRLFLTWNDALYVAHHLVFLPWGLMPSLPASLQDSVTFVDLLPLFRQRLAESSFLQGDASIRKSIHTSLLHRERASPSWFLLYFNSQLLPLFTGGVWSILDVAMRRKITTLIMADLVLPAYLSDLLTWTLDFKTRDLVLSVNRVVLDIWSAMTSHASDVNDLQKKREEELLSSNDIWNAFHAVHRILIHIHTNAHMKGIDVMKQWKESSGWGKSDMKTILKHCDVSQVVRDSYLQALEADHS